MEFTTTVLQARVAAAGARDPVAQATTPETRARRVEKAFESLRG